MLTDAQIHILIEAIKQLAAPSDLEKDIIDTSEKVSKQFLNPLDAQVRIDLNYRKYDDLYKKVNALPTTVQKDFSQIDEADWRYILQMQLIFLLEKNQAEKHNG